MLLTLRKLPVIGLSFVHIINSNMRDIHTERSDKFCCLHFLYYKYLQNWRLQSDITSLGPGLGMHQ
jgi:hypothetical protein